jgi:hypothetical protein
MSRTIELRDETGDDCGDCFSAADAGGCLSFSIENPWAGDSASGFGASCDFSMTREQAARLRDWLSERLRP